MPEIVKLILNTIQFSKLEYAWNYQVRTILIKMSHTKYKFNTSELINIFRFARTKVNKVIIDYINETQY